MGSLKSSCRTSYRSSIETIAPDCLVFEKKTRFCVRILVTDRQTSGRTDEQMDKPSALSRLCYRERRFNNVHFVCTGLWRQRQNTRSGCGSGLFLCVYSLVISLTAGWARWRAASWSSTAVYRPTWKRLSETSSENSETSAKSAPLQTVSQKFWCLFLCVTDNRSDVTKLQQCMYRVIQKSTP